MPAVSRPLPGIAAASREVLARMVSADPVLLNCVATGDALGLADRLVLHAGPPIAWAAMCRRSKAPSWARCATRAGRRATRTRSGSRERAPFAQSPDTV